MHDTEIKEERGRKKGRGGISVRGKRTKDGAKHPPPPVHVQVVYSTIRGNSTRVAYPTSSSQAFPCRAHHVYLDKIRTYVQYQYLSNIQFRPLIE